VYPILELKPRKLLPSEKIPLTQQKRKLDNKILDNQISYCIVSTILDVQHENRGRFLPCHWRKSVRPSSLLYVTYEQVPITNIQIKENQFKEGMQN
jgi:hypothetical protein